MQHIGQRSTMVNKGLMRDLNQAITLDIRWLLLYWYFGGLSIPGSVRSSLRVRWPCQYRETGQVWLEQILQSVE